MVVPPGSRRGEYVSPSGDWHAFSGRPIGTRRLYRRSGGGAGAHAARDERPCGIVSTSNQSDTLRNMCDIIEVDVSFVHHLYSWSHSWPYSWTVSLPCCCYRYKSAPVAATCSSVVSIGVIQCDAPASPGATNRPCRTPGTSARAALMSAASRRRRARRPEALCHRATSHHS